MLKWVTWMHCKSLWIKASAKCTSTFTRVFLNMSIYTSTWVKDVCTFAISAVLLDIVVGGAVALVKRFRMRRRGMRAGALVKLRQRRFRTLLSSIHLATLHSLPNKMDKLLLLSRTNKDFWNSAALYFTETWLNDATPDSALHLPNFHHCYTAKRMHIPLSHEQL